MNKLHWCINHNWWAVAQHQHKSVGYCFANSTFTLQILNKVILEWLLFACVSVLQVKTFLDFSEWPTAKYRGFCCHPCPFQSKFVPSLTYKYIDTQLWACPKQLTTAPAPNHTHTLHIVILCYTSQLNFLAFHANPEQLGDFSSLANTMTHNHEHVPSNWLLQVCYTLLYNVILHSWIFGLFLRPLSFAKQVCAFPSLANILTHNTDHVPSNWLLHQLPIILCHTSPGEVCYTLLYDVILHSWTFWLFMPTLRP